MTNLVFTYVTVVFTKGCMKIKITFRAVAQSLHIATIVATVQIGKSTEYITNSRDQSPYREANRSSATQIIRRILRNQVHYRIHNSLTPVYSKPDQSRSCLPKTIS
jgi:hypothetical protein